jgi:hypothetical protein
MIQSLFLHPASPSQAHLNLYNLYAHSEAKFRVGDGFRLLLDGNLVPIFLAFPFTLLLSNYHTAVDRSMRLVQNLNVYVRGGLTLFYFMAVRSLNDASIVFKNSFFREPYIYL